MKKVWTLVLGWMALGLLAFNAAAVDLADIEKKLTSSGVEGWIHGSVSNQGLYVFTYRTPGQFFDYIEMSLVSDDPAMQKKFASLNRHDRVRIKGKFLKNPSPQKHIEVASLEMLEAYSSGLEKAPYAYEAKIPDDLTNLKSARFLVHAIAGDGHILVVEYKDAILPVFVKNGDLTKGLFRNDLVELKFVIRGEPDSPVHLGLDEKSDQPVKVIESIRSLHGKPASMTGSLILFPQSPEIVFNVFAVKQDLPDGLNRQFTLVNFDSPELFTKIRASLQAAWDRHPKQYVNGRNKFISTADPGESDRHIQ